MPSRRRQIRPVLVALALILAAYLVLVLLRPDLGADAFGLVLATPRLQALYEINSLLLITGAVFALPFSIVLAVVRYRLFDIDLLVNRALVYGAIDRRGHGGLSRRHDRDRRRRRWDSRARGHRDARSGRRRPSPG